MDYNAPTGDDPVGNHPVGNSLVRDHPVRDHPVRGRFDWIAPLYDWIAFLVFRNRLKQAQLVFLNRIQPGSSVLIVGGGTGWILEQLLLTTQPGRVLYLEASAQMLARTSQRMIRKAIVGTVEFRRGDEQSLSLDERFDVIITPFVLDLFTESTLRKTVIPRLKSALRPDGYWLVTDFVNPRRRNQRALLWLMIRFFRLTAQIEAHVLAEWGTCLDQAGMSVSERVYRVRGMVVAELRRSTTDS